MGNSGSISNMRYHHQHHHRGPAPPQPSRPQMNQNQYVFAASTPYPSHNPNPYYNHYPGQSQYPSPLPVPGAYAYHHMPGSQYRPGGGGVAQPPVVPIVEHQKAVTIKNDINVKKETLRVEPDEENPGKFLVAFTFDATAPGSITVMFFAKEGTDCNLTATKEELLKPVTISFQQGLGQKFRQPSGMGIDFMVFDEAALTKEGSEEIYPLVVKAEACPSDHSGSEASSAGNSQITMAVFEKKEHGEYHVRVVKQILWVNRVRYELQEIYGIGNTVGGDVDENDSGKDCVICLSEPRDTTVLPCRHMCMCSGCAKVLQFQMNRCPICRQPVERLLEIKVNNTPEAND